MTRPTVAVLTTGGTIASLRDPDTGAVRTAATADDLLAMVPDLHDIADVTATPQAAVNSWNMTPPMMADLVVTAIAELVKERVSGVVVTHHGREPRGASTVVQVECLAGRRPTDCLRRRSREQCVRPRLGQHVEADEGVPRHRPEHLDLSHDPPRGGRGPDRLDRPRLRRSAAGGPP